VTDRAPEGGSGGADVRHVTLVPRRALRWLLMCGLVIGVGYALLLTHPQPLFAYELQHAGIVVHATQPIPDEMRATLDRARARLKRGRRLIEVAKPGCEAAREWVEPGAKPARPPLPGSDSGSPRARRCQHARVADGMQARWGHSPSFVHS